MRKILGTFGATVLAGITAAAIATPAAAAACVPVEAVPATEAVYETVEVTPARPAVPAVEEVSHVETTDWTTDQPGPEWTEVDRREVVTVEGVPAWTEVIIDEPEIPAGYEQTDWVLEAPADGRTWVQIAERYVVDVEAKPAVGEPTIWVEEPNPDYVPESTIEHPAEYRTMWKYTKHGGHGFIWIDNDDYKYIVDGVGKDKANWKDWLFSTVYERTQHTKQELVKAAWTETIPAQGEPTIEVEKPNPDYVPAVEEQGHTEYKFAWHQPYVPAVTHTVEHEAIEQVSHLEYKFERTVIDVAAVPGVDAVPAVTEEVLVTEAVPAIEAVVCPAAPLQPRLQSSSSEYTTTDRPDNAPVQDESLLAETGADGIGVAAAAGLLLLGVGCVVVARRRQTI